MGRRALRKIDPNIDLTRFYVESERLPNPWDAGQLFGREAPLVIEVGSGKGLFIARAAADHPERNLLGIELARKYARLSALKLARIAAEHAKMVQGDAQPIFADLLPSGSVSEVHIYFPDPWWKKRHRRRRIMNETFVSNVQRVLSRGGKLHFWSDVEEYFEIGLELIRTVTELQGPHTPAAEPAEDDLDYRTHFERRMRQHGLDVFRSQFTKSG